MFTGKSSFSVPSKRMSTAALAETEKIQMRERERRWSETDVLLFRESSIHTG